MDRSRARWTGTSSVRRNAVAALVGAICLAAAPAETPPARDSRAALEKAVADYVGLYTRSTLDRWRSLFHPAVIVAYPREDGGIKTRGLDEFFKAQKDYFETGRAVSERLEHVRIEAGFRIARVSADFVFVDEGDESRGRLGLHLVEGADGWKITSVVFAYDKP